MRTCSKARTVFVGLLLLPARLRLGERGFIVLAGLKGAVPGGLIASGVSSIARDIGTGRETIEHAQVRWGDPLDELVEFTRSDTVVVVGTSRRHGVGLHFRRPLGARLAARAHGPVIVVPVGTNSVERAGVYVGIAGSEGGNLALDFAAREASLRGETLHIVHAWTEQSARRKGTARRRGGRAARDHPSVPARPNGEERRRVPTFSQACIAPPTGGPCCRATQPRRISRVARRGSSPAPRTRDGEAAFGELLLPRRHRLSHRSRRLRKAQMTRTW